MPNESRRKLSEKSSELKNLPLTCSKTSPYNRDMCFFCDQDAGYRQPLHIVSTSSACNFLDKAVKMLGDEKLLLKLSTAVDSKDGHVIDIKS